MKRLLTGYLLCLALGLLVWYGYSLISHSLHEGLIYALLPGNHLLYLVVLATMEGVIFLALRGKQSKLLPKVSPDHTQPTKLSFLEIGIATLFILAGVVLSVLHFTLNRNIPLFVGLFSLGAGSLALLAQFDYHAIVHEGLVPLGLGIFFVAIPLTLIFMLAEQQESPLTIASFFATFNYNAALIFFLAFAPLLIWGGLTNIIKHLRRQKNDPNQA